MVNTFLVCADFQQSAQTLDRQRLGKQRVEAVEILNNLYYLRAISILVNSPLPQDPYQYQVWRQDTMQRYKKSKYRLYRRVYRMPNESLAPDHKFCFTVWPTTGNTPLRNSPVLFCPHGWFRFRKPQTDRGTPKSPIRPYDHQISIRSGYIHHPAIYMWLGYEDCLREYTDLHIAEWIRRGYRNTMSRYPFRGHPRPPWTQDPDFHRRHRSNLLHKELVRQEKPWYRLRDDFDQNDLLTADPESVNQISQLKYIWPYSLTLGSTAQLSGLADVEQRYRK